MYEQYGLKDPFFLMLYGCVTTTALLGCLYILVTPRSHLAAHVMPPKALRYWTAAFLFIVTASHIWWAVLGTIWLQDDKFLRNTTAIMLDYVTIVPLMMAVFLNLLQDRKRMLWPFVIAHIPIIVMAIYGMVTENIAVSKHMLYYQVAIIAIFVIYYVRALRQYDRWLYENFADFEHKEVWRSLLFLFCFMVLYYAYTSNSGEMTMEYLSQVLSLFIVSFLVWRVETLQTLMPSEVELATSDNNDMASSASKNNDSYIALLLQSHCEDTQLYLQHDLTLSQLSAAIGTNRTYLSSYFAQQGETYNTYINRLRIKHFIQLYHEAVNNSRPFTAQELSHQCGYRTYRTFSIAFKQHVGVPVTTWIKSEKA